VKRKLRRGERWDWVAVVRYEILRDFRDMGVSEMYREEVEPHRVAGLEEWRVVAVQVVAVGE